MAEGERPVEVFQGKDQYGQLIVWRTRSFVRVTMESYPNGIRFTVFEYSYDGGHTWSEYARITEGMESHARKQEAGKRERYDH